jgi:hypothetical protein
MADTVPSSPFVGRDGLGKLQSLGTLVDSSNINYPQHVLRSGGLPVDDNNPLPIASPSTALTNSAAVATSPNAGTASILVPASETRKWLAIYNRDPTNTHTVDVGSANVVNNGGIPISPQGGFIFSGEGAAGPIYAVSTAASVAMSFVEG